jgi:anaerobic selenocysteine-containing dehydrogenase
VSDPSLSRRDFLLYGGGVLAGITLGELGRRRLARADERAGAWHGRAVESWATSVCGECPAACGIRVRLIDEAPVKLEGNPLCPLSRGRLCAKGQAALESYYDPDRLLGPAKRVGKRGEGQWERITWDEAVAALASRLKETRGRDLVLAVAAEEQGPLADAWTRFWTAAGARVAWTPAATAARLGPAFRALTGASADPLFDLEHASYVLSFGAPLAEDWLSGVWTQRSYGRFRRGSSTRGRLVQVEARRSLTARKADEWLAVHSERQAVLDSNRLVFQAVHLRKISPAVFAL